MPSHTHFEIRRVYDELQPGGYRVLVDRLWPRGVSKEKAHIDEWSKDVAPSDELRRWYGHEPERFPEFARRYRAEMKKDPAKEAIDHLRAASNRSRIVLVTATRDVDHSGAAVLLDALAGRRTRTKPGRPTTA